jgi:hypothetical protein
MFQENEIVMVILGSGTLIFISLYYNHVKRIPFSRLLLCSFCFLCAGWFATVLEGVFLGDLLNLLEHLSYATSSILLAAWCWQTRHTSSHTP